MLGHPAQGELVQRALAAAGSGAEPGPGRAGPHPAAAAPARGTAPAAEVEPVYVEGTGWMRWDADTQAWVATRAATALAPRRASPAAALAGCAGTRDGATRRRMPLPPRRGTAAPAAEPRSTDADAPLEPATVAAQVTEQIALPALTEALAATPQLADLSAEELNQLMSEVLAERLAAAG